MAKIGLISIGNELLNGHTVNTNASEIGQSLRLEGWDVLRSMTIKDQRNEIIFALDSLFSVCDAIIITGGLGPTTDDITKEVLCEYFGGGWKVDEPTKQRLIHWYTERNRPLNEFTLSQCKVPAECRVLPNLMGTAPGMLFEKEQKRVFSLPGVPQEMRYILHHSVLPELKEHYQSSILSRRVLMTYGKSESEIAKEIDAEIKESEQVSLAFLPANGGVKIVVTAVSEALVREKHDELISLFKPHVFSEYEATLEQVLGELLIQNKLTLGLAESCTGGAVSSLITSVSGSSNFFQGAVVSYSEQMKIRQLKVPVQLIQEKGIVSADVAVAMAKGARSALGTDIGVGITGTAEVSPDDNEYSKPEIWIGYADKFGVKTFKGIYRQDRQSNIRSASRRALFFCLKNVQENFCRE